MEIHSTLPFTSALFFKYMTLCILSFLFAKHFLSKFIPYKLLLLVFSAGYIGLLFTKPIHIIILVCSLFILIKLLRKYYKRDNILLPMLLISIPILALKSTVFIEENPESYTVRDFKDFVTIAGLSYIVFKVISLYIDERNSNEKINLVDYFNYTLFVPTLLIGPLNRFKQFKTDTSNGYSNITIENYKKGFNNLVIGLLFKFILAQFIGTIIIFELDLVEDKSFLYHTAYMISYLLYLFFDFAGYTLLSISFANFIGITIPINFNKPFLSENPKDFWKRWHKSLGDWLNDYFFKPIFKYLTTKKYRTSIQRQNIALMLTFTLMGFWNGFQLHYIVSGMLFGLYSVTHNYYVYKCKRLKRDVIFGNLSIKYVRLISIIIMFLTVAIAIYIFSGKLF